MSIWTDSAAARPVYQTDRQDRLESGRLEPVNCFSLANWENEGGAVPLPEPARTEQPAIG
ncbi:hypothetical protein [Aquibaculum arenosum]|uniref:Uncharacterized protein n=1 Tax=Aquibaculum arenosum TaxID=3032591 RepID=A0ABT5YLN4_9PROT|nr:hypothetical protein [Fodinicurvata sp. CAU 1616]MDF2095772.1 hypothetical protein [Fodinicurvata sp. CAU 1616]